MKVLTISLIIGVAIYIVLGVIVMKTKYSASGVDLIPNKVFWKNFPGLLKVTYMHPAAANQSSFLAGWCLVHCQSVHEAKSDLFRNEIIGVMAALVSIL